ncbi:MAG: HAD family hydrolase [Dehalococcoidia bacterium]
MPSDPELTGAPRAALLLDLDGVIVDSRVHHLSAWRRLALRHGIDAPPGYFGRRSVCGTTGTTRPAADLGDADLVVDSLAGEAIRAFITR